ncbi:acyltransferase family protein [Tropicimonas sp. IMCC34011]|uniref:acyltransferase family protein n=1 Tax=Tropicimonas sp. IMCC34011 TaxID=2248759 RepID=UPI000E24F4D4|nr:acyltransferase family protein [Tropicimonas sp. IMCC34011]
MSRLPSIDTFRGIGVSLVLWTHAGLPGAPGAFVGIDAFFMISGFLVTTSFLRLFDRLRVGEGDASSFTLYRTASVRFLEARVRRILLPLFAAIFLTLAAGWVLLLPGDLYELADAALMSVLLSGNLHAASTGDYFDMIVQAEPLLHTWSLALEEQFYLLSLVIMAAWALLPRTWGFWALVLGGGLFSLALAQIYSTDPDLKGASYYLFSTRVWEFLMGVALAPLVRGGIFEGRLGRWLTCDIAFALGWVLVFGSIAILTPDAPSPGLVSLPALIGMGLIIIGQPRSRFLAERIHLRPITYAGRNLYGIYLFHFPVVVYLAYVDPPLGAWMPVVSFVASYAVALALGALIELPFERWRSPRFRIIVGLDLLLLAGIFGLATLIWQSGGAPERMPEAAQRAYLGKYLVNPERGRCMEGELTAEGYSCSYGAPSERKVVLIGDSHSDMLANQLGRALEERGLQTLHFWSYACPAIGARLYDLDVFGDDCTRLSFEAHDRLSAMQGVEAVIYAALWPSYLGYSEDDVPQEIASGRAGGPGAANLRTYREAFQRQFLDTVRGLTARGIEVYIVAPVPILERSPADEEALNAWYRPRSWTTPLNEALGRDAYEAQGEVFQAVIAPLRDVDGVYVLDPGDVLCPDETCRQIEDGTPLYYDETHLNERGAEAVVRHWFP